MYVCARSRFSLFFFFNDTATTEIYTLSLHDAFRSLQGHRLLKNRSLWRNFGTLRNERWHHEKVVLLGDAAHTAHFSVGSGTKLAMEDAVALARALNRAQGGNVPAALDAYEAERRPAVESLQRAAQVSLQWVGGTERYRDLVPVRSEERPVGAEGRSPGLAEPLKKKQWYD